MPHLFGPIRFRSLTLANRIVVSPMCQYSSVNGLASDWHLVHLGSRAIGGAGLVFTEACAVTPEGRISPDDLGIWSDLHIESLARITRFVRQQGSAVGIQLAHAGRKGSTYSPFTGQGAVPVERGGWQPVGPVETAFAANYAVPHALTRDEITGVVEQFSEAATRALEAGFEVAEIHAAHGYLIHEFLSPLSNTRTDEYGGAFEHRIRLCLEVASAVRQRWPDHLPVFVRISATDWTDGGWDLEQSVELARRLRAIGIDLVDCSSGGNLANVVPHASPGYQVPFAERIRRDAGVATGAVGLITGPEEANAIIERGQADCVFLAREMLRDPYWPLRAARQLGQSVPWPAQYLRAAPPDSPSR